MVLFLFENQPFGSCTGTRTVSSSALISSQVKTSQPRARKPATALSAAFSALFLA